MEKGAQVSDEPLSRNDVPKKAKIEPGDGLHPLPWPYSHGWKVGNLLFIAGQVALDEELRLIGPGDAEEQTRQVWRNIKAVVEKAGGKLSDVVRVSTYVTDIADIDAIMEARREFFPDGDYPVATMVEVAKLGLPGLLLETEAMALAVKSPEVTKTFETAGSPVAYLDAPEFSGFVAEDSARLIAAVKKIGKVE